MWWILIPAGAVLVSAVVALRGRRRVTAARFDSSLREQPGETPPA